MDNDQYLVWESAEDYGFRGEVRVDEYIDESDNPRNWDNLSVMVCEHRNYELGDTTLEKLTGYSLGDFADRLKGHASITDLIERYIRMRYKARAFTWLSMLDHSGLHIYAGSGSHWSDPGGWDSGLIGFAFVPGPGAIYVKDSRVIVQEDDTSSEEAQERMHREIETYDAYIRGEIYYYTITDREGDVVDSCSGFVGDNEYAEKEMKESLATEVKKYKMEQWSKVEIDEPPTLIGVN